MLDAFIIERIKQEQEQRERTRRQPLRIERRPMREPRRRDSQDEDEERVDRGITIIEF